MISYRTVIQAVLLVSNPKVRQWPSVDLTFFDSAHEGKSLAAVAREVTSSEVQSGVIRTLKEVDLAGEFADSTFSDNLLSMNCLITRASFENCPMYCSPAMRRSGTSLVACFVLPTYHCCTIPRLTWNGRKPNGTAFCGSPDSSEIYVLTASFPLDSASRSLVRSAKFEFLREDITCSLNTRHPLKLDLVSLQSLQLFHPSFTNRQPKYLALCSARGHHLFFSILSAPSPVAGYSKPLESCKRSLSDYCSVVRWRSNGPFTTSLLILKVIGDVNEG